MKRYCAFLLALVMIMALFSACTNNKPPEPTPSESQTPEPEPRDYSGVDFTGVWAVSQVLDSLGVPVSQDKLNEIGADYTIELLGGGMYIICDAEGKEIGQGQYTVAQDKLKFSAGSSETVYTVRDEDTILCTADDGSVTVMTRSVDTSGNGNEEATASPTADIESAPTQSS